MSMSFAIAEGRYHLDEARLDYLKTAPGNYLVALMIHWRRDRQSCKPPRPPLRGLWTLPDSSSRLLRTRSRCRRWCCRL